MGDQGQLPRPIEWRPGEAQAQAVRTGSRHARRPCGPRDTAGFQKRGQEDALLGRCPLGSIGRGRRPGWMTEWSHRWRGR